MQSLQRFTCKVIGTAVFGNSATGVPGHIALSSTNATEYMKAAEHGEVEADGEFIVPSDAAHVVAAIESVEAIQRWFKKNPDGRKAYELARRHAADLKLWRFWQENFGV